MNAATLARLAALKGQPKFVDEPGTIYNGMRPEADRLAAETQLNELIERLIDCPEDTPARRFVLAQFRETLAHFPGYDTEDRERICRYLRQIPDILVSKAQAACSLAGFMDPFSEHSPYCLSVTRSDDPPPLGLRWPRSSKSTTAGAAR
jgi:hypothetical protein